MEIRREDLHLGVALDQLVRRIPVAEVSRHLDRLAREKLTPSERLRLLVLKKVAVQGRMSGMRWDSEEVLATLLSARTRHATDGLHSSGACSLRIDLAMGGLSDLPPVDVELGARTVSLPFRFDKSRQPVRAMIRPARGNYFRFRSSRAGADETWESLEVAIHASKIPLVPLTLKLLSEDRDISMPFLDVAILIDVEEGAGLGGSGSLVVAVLSAASDFLGFAGVPWVNIAMSVEAYLGSMGGWEDIVAAGSRRLTSFSVNVGSVRIKSAGLNASTVEEHLCRHLVLVRTEYDRSGVYASPLGRLFVQYLLGFQKVVETVVAMNELSESIWQGCLAGDVETVARLASEQWRLWCECTNDVAGRREVNTVVEMLGKEYRVLGAKLCGAGTGGYVLIFIEPGSRRAILDHLATIGRKALVPQLSP